jgi:hypothetical protein
MTTSGGHIVPKTSFNIFHLLLNALILQIPFSHLTKVEEFVVLVESPGHVENVGMKFALQKGTHELARLLMKLVAA